MVATVPPRPPASARKRGVPAWLVVLVVIAAAALVREGGTWKVDLSGPPPR